jgi:hypothetical protein
MRDELASLQRRTGENSHDDGVIFMLNQRVLALERMLP